ncbi:MAG: glycosyltransferase family 2 protein [Solirubrobacteraceae bacterium]
MKLVMTLLVRNEVDVIQANLEYHLAQGVDFVIVTDHGSEDGTSEILREYERMGVAKVIRDEEEGHHQSNRVTRMAEIAHLGHSADWVFHNDADEFWWPLVGDLRDVFSSLPPHFGQIEVQRRNFRPRVDGEGPFYSRLVYREASSLNLSGHALESKIAHRPHPDVVVAPGNHSIQGADLSTVPAGEVLEIFHFPMRSYEQFEHKVVQIGHGYEQLPDRSPMVGSDQLALLELHRAGKLRDYYDGLVLDRAALERGLQMGTIVVDRRLEDFMRGVHSGERSHARPDAPFAGVMLQRMMDALDELEQSREELATLRSEGERERERAEHEQGRAEHERERAERERAHSEQLQRQITEMSVNLEHSMHELQSTSQALHLLRSSRLLRSTAIARRLYYRATGKT